MTWTAIMTTILCGGLCLGCYSADEALVRGGGNLQKKGPTLGAEDSKGIAATGSKARKIASATYFVEIETQSGAKPCEGVVNIDILSDFGIGLPESKVSCASLTIDLGKMLAAQLQNGPALDMKSFSSDGKIFSASELLGAKFDPPRPMLVGPLVQDISQFANFTRRVESTVNVAKPDSGNPITATGAFTAKVLDVGSRYNNKFLKQPFENVMHWTMETEGFAGVPAKYGLLFKKWEWYWNVRPIMIPKIIITMDNIGGMIESKSSDGLSDLVGEIKVTITVKDYDFGGG